MTKTPEEMAEEEADRIERQAILCVSLLAMNDGEYFAAKKAYKAGYQAAKAQVANVSKAMPKWNSVDTVGDLINRSAIQHTLAALEKKPAQQWISVKERLPEDGVDVVIGWFQKTASNKTFWTVDAAQLTNKVFSGWRVYSEVTHWQPLPAAPKEEV